RADKLALENQSLQARLQPLAKNPDAVQALREENAMLKKQVATLQAASKSSGGTDGSTELAKLRAQVAQLRSEADVNWLEKMALENRLKKSPPDSATQTSEVNPPAPASAPMENASAPAPAENSNPAATASFEAAVTTAETNSTMETPNNSTAASASVAQALSEIQANNLSAADTHLSALVAQNPNDAAVLSAYGYLKFLQQDYDTALDVLNRAAKLDPQNAQVQNYLGVTLSHKGQRAAAETALLKAIELDPGYGSAHNNLAVIYINDQPPKAELARWHYQKALQGGQQRNADLEKLLASKGAPVAAQ
ncbi:MAG TPA: tetratricopeptide repeat protein, partial [Candidatus Baltobacteraceae bacterium]|nr:tetratricopeptide repeat protein [Candidatus Baltobacteraceae bacterium]